MTDGIESKLVEEVAEVAIEKLSPLTKIWNAVKKITTTLIILKWIGVIFLAWFDNVRRAVIMSALDKYPENKVWKTVLWIKTWRYIYGLIFGLLLAFYFDLDQRFIDLINWIIDFWNQTIQWIN